MRSSLQSRLSAVHNTPVVTNSNDFSQVYQAYAPLVSRWARRLGGPETDPEDVTQEVFSVVLRRLHEFDPGKGEIGGWIYGITVRVVQGLRRRRRVRHWLASMFGRSAQEMPPEPPSPEAAMVADEAKSLLYRLLDKLPEAHRTAFILYEVEELDGSTIASLTNTSTANVWVRVHRARRLLEAAARQSREEEES